MKPLLNPTQKAHYDKVQRLFFSPEAKAARNNPELQEYGIREAQELGMLDALYSGWKNLEPRYGKNGKQLKGLKLVNDDAIEMDPAEQLEFLINETQHVRENGESFGKYHTMDPEDREFVKQAILKHVFSGSIGGDSIAALGTKGRHYPKNYHDPKLAGKKMKADWQPGQRQERGMQILLDRAELIDTATNVGLHGQIIDALHNEAAANNPALLTAVSNIRPGNAGLNRAVGNYTGVELDNALKNRQSNLRDLQFELENGISPTQRGGIDKATNAENLYFGKIMPAADALIAEIRNDKNISSTRMALDKVAPLIGY